MYVNVCGYTHITTTGFNLSMIWKIAASKQARMSLRDELLQWLLSSKIRSAELLFGTTNSTGPSVRPANSLVPSQRSFYSGCFDMWPQACGEAHSCSGLLTATPMVQPTTAAGMFRNQER